MELMIDTVASPMTQDMVNTATDCQRLLITCLQGICIQLHEYFTLVYKLYHNRKCKHT